MSVTHIFGQADSADKVVNVTTALTLTNGDSGKLFELNASPGKAVTLPALIPGMKFKFKVASLFATTAWTIVLPVAKGQGGAIVNSVFVPAADETTITLSATADTIGDWIEIEYGTTNIYINGVGAQASSIAFS
jgi:hypothetical protein